MKITLAQLEAAAQAAAVSEFDTANWRSHMRATEAAFKTLGIEVEDDPADVIPCEGHETTDGPIGNVVYCDGSCTGPEAY